MVMQTAEVSDCDDRGTGCPLLCYVRKLSSLSLSLRSQWSFEKREGLSWLATDFIERLFGLAPEAATASRQRTSRLRLRSCCSFPGAVRQS